MSFAFSYGDLQAHHCTQSPDLTAALNLDNRVHPIFQRRNFRVGVVTDGLGLFYTQDHRWQLDTDVFPAPLYARILPAVRLASLMLDRSMPFFNRLTHAVEIRHPRLPNHAYLDPIDNTSPSVNDQSVQSLCGLADNIRFYISGRGRDALSPSGDRWQGITYSTLKSQVSPVSRICIGLEHGFIDFFAGGQYARASEEQQLRTCFMLARLMMHELAHAVRQWRVLNEVSVKASKEGREVSIFGGPSTVEPWYCDVTQELQDPENELGRAWEEWFFGGLIKPIGLSRDFSVPFGFSIVNWSDWFEQRQHAEIGTRHIYTALTAASVSRLFDKRSWSAPEATRSGVVVRLTPLTAAINGVHGFDRIIPRLMRTVESQRWVTESLPLESTGQL